MAREYPDELLADFQQYYHLNLWELGLDADTEVTTAEVRRASILAAQLPRDSRVKVAIAPAASHDWKVLLLREIEHNQRLWQWAHTKEAKHKETAPQPITLPGEEEAYESAVEQNQRTASDIAQRFGLEI